MARVKVGDGGGESTPAALRASREDRVAGAGWHPDPFDLAEERWWDGARWTTHVREAPPEESHAVEEPDETPSDEVRGRPPGWYPWRGEVSRWWDGEEWGPARRAFADHEEPRRAPGRIGMARGRLRLAALLLLVVLGVVLVIALSGGGSSGLGAYRARIGKLCTRTFAVERAEILKESTAAVSGRGKHSGRRKHSQAVLVGALLRVLARESATFDAQVQAIPPPSALVGAQQRFLALEHQDSAIYALVVPRVEGRRGLPALTTVTGLISKNAQTVQRLLVQLGGPACSISPLGIG